MVAHGAGDAVLTVVLALGARILVGLFFADGIVVGKLLQPPAVFVAYVAVTTPARSILLAVCAGCVLAATLGQWSLYRGFNDEAPEFVGLRRVTPYLDDLPAVVQRRVGERQLRFVERIFDRYGAAGICLTNAVPGIRSLVSIPAGLSAYPRRRFLLAWTAGNVLYVALLLAIAVGLLELVGLVAS